MTFTIRPLPWKEVHRDHWQAVTSLGTWDVFYCYIACIDAQRWNWRLTTLDGEAIIECGFCEGLEDGARLAEEARNRLITPALEPVKDGELDRAKAVANERMLNDCARIEDLEKALKDCRAMITGERRTNLINALRITIDEALARHKAGKGGGA